MKTLPRISWEKVNERKEKGVLQYWLTVIILLLGSDRKSRGGAGNMIVFTF